MTATANPEVEVPRAAVVLAAVVVGALFGPLDLAGQVHAPYPFAHLFNSPALWAAAAFCFGVWARLRSRSVIGAVISAIVLEVVAVEAYYVADVIVRGSSTSVLTSTVAIAWLLLGVGAGAIFGSAGAMIDEPGGVRRAVARGLLPGVFLAEAAHQVIRNSTTSADDRPDDLLAFAAILAVLAAVSLVAVLWSESRSARLGTMAATAAITGVGAAGFAVLVS